MLEIGRLSEDNGWIGLSFLEREAAPKFAMKLGIRMHLARLPLSDTVSILEMLGVDRHRTTVHTWEKTDLQPACGLEPDHVAIDETVIQINHERFWLYAAVDTDTHRSCVSRSLR